MILVDANLLIYAHFEEGREHARARAWLDDRLSGPAPVGLPWPALLAFVRLVTNPRVFEKAEHLADAWARVEEWLSSPSVWIPQPTERHAEVLGRFLRASGMGSSHVMDAHLAALAIEHGLTLCSADGDFARFEGLRWENPLR